jgi:hypothetical protein
MFWPGQLAPTDWEHRNTRQTLITLITIVKQQVRSWGCCCVVLRLALLTLENNKTETASDSSSFATMIAALLHVGACAVPAKTLFSLPRATSHGQLRGGAARDIPLHDKRMLPR